MNANILDLDYEDLRDLFAGWDEPAYRADQVWQGLYQHLWEDWEEFTPLPLGLRDRLGAEFQIGQLVPKSELLSEDKLTRKILFQIPGGDPVETVLMVYNRRNTLCISTQSGCAMGCTFCATGQMGFKSNLSTGHIVEQVVHFTRRLRRESVKITNVVLMGMGEPFHNYEASLAAVRRLNHPEGMRIGARRFTISTVGLVPAIRRFTKENSQINLAVSLHAADDGLRNSILPINKKYPLEMLMVACREYVEFTGRRISFEWALIRDFNDSPDQASKLVTLIGDMNCHVNLIPLNPTRDYAGEATPRQRAAEFQEILQRNRISCTIRARRGLDIHAGCGQLASL